MRSTLAAASVAPAPLPCAHLEQTWGPHEGCREFMTEPELWACGEPASHLVLAVEFDGEGDWVPSTYAVCDKHRARCVDELTSSQYARNVRSIKA